MSAAFTNNDVALPHAGLLAFFSSRTPSSCLPDCDCASFPYDKSNASSTILVLDTEDFNTADEESKCGFWGKQDEYMHEPKPTHLSKIRRSPRGLFAFCCFWYVVSICILGAFFTVDVVLTQFDMGTGMSRWMVHGNAVQSVGRSEVSGLNPSIRTTAKTCRNADVLLSRVTEPTSTRTTNMALH
jgi:hypothetical protein